MTGRVIIITGANSGIGYLTSKILCEGGNEVILACRNEEKGKAAVESILKENPNALASFLQLDLTDLASVRSFVEEFHKLDKKLNVLINNAGISQGKLPVRSFTKDNFEITMGTNHLGHFLLTQLLLEDLKKTATETGDSRVVIVTSSLHDTKTKYGSSTPINMDDIFLAEYGSYNAFLAYKNSKLGNVLYTFGLAKQLEGTGVTVNCMCPGFIPTTELGRSSSRPMKFFTRYILGGMLKFTKVTRTADQGARAEVDLATNEELKGVSGKYFFDKQEKKSSDESLDEELQKKMWELSARYCHLDGYEPLDAPVPPTPEEIKAQEEAAKLKAKEDAEKLKQEKQKAKEEAQKAKEEAQKAKEEAKKKSAEEKKKAEEETKAKAAEEKQTADTVKTNVEEAPKTTVEEATEKVDETVKEVSEKVEETVDDLKKTVTDEIETKKDKLGDVITEVTPVEAAS